MSLKAHLFSAYGGFADKRIKNLDKGKIFAIDDRQERDVGSDGDLYSYFCTMFVTVSEPDELELMLDRNAPYSSQVVDYVRKHGGQLNGGSGSANLKMRIRPQDAAVLRGLAATMRAITAPGMRYTVSNYKYVVPRTATSLERLADVLDDYSKPTI
ncbi:hypothetical protein ACN28I_17385 [Archangium gephyra]|uniref:hypothetical protein n=1 Tax=Archangium gephyra TaxID=48 RepID=UPI003B82223D